MGAVGPGAPGPSPVAAFTGAREGRDMTQKDAPADRIPRAGLPSPEVLSELVRTAALAPSMHNTQPWRFRARRRNTRTDWLRAGQALQRVLLTATRRGIAVSPLTQPLETAGAWLVRDPQSGGESPQMILRLGYGLPVPGTPRRPVAEVLDES